MKKTILLLAALSLVATACDTSTNYQSEFTTETPEPFVPSATPEFQEPEPPAPKKQVPTPSEAYEPISNCDPNYFGCVPIASDVDCAGGSGDGPEYVRGPASVIGEDVYGLDRDGDGVACE